VEKEANSDAVRLAKTLKFEHGSKITRRALSRIIDDQSRRRLTDYGQGANLDTYNRLFQQELESKL